MATAENKSTKKLKKSFYDIESDSDLEDDQVTTWLESQDKRHKDTIERQGYSDIDLFFVDGKKRSEEILQEISKNEIGVGKHTITWYKSKYCKL